jgi:ketosteroid isomerase-like protein
LADVGEPGPRALDLRGLGTRRFLQLGRLGAPEIEFVRADAPEDPSPSTGLVEMAEGAREFLSAWEEYRAQADEYRELDDERVLVLVRQSGRGKTSGLEVGQLGVRGATLFHIRGGEVTRLVLYWDRERALADLGLAPEAGAP